MNIFKKKGVQIALLGGAFGGILDIILKIYENTDPPFVSIFYGLAFIPLFGGLFLAEVIISPLCNFAEDPHYCRAGWLDGGPMDWAIYLCIYIFSILFYGFVFWGIYRVVKFFKEKKRRYENIKDIAKSKLQDTL